MTILDREQRSSARWGVLAASGTWIANCRGPPRLVDPEEGGWSLPSCSVSGEETRASEPVAANLPRTAGRLQVAGEAPATLRFQASENRALTRVECQISIDTLDRTRLPGVTRGGFVFKGMIPCGRGADDERRSA